MLIIGLGTVYVLSFIFARRNIRKWMLKYRIEPSLTPVFFTILPLVNTVAMFAFAEGNGRKISGKFFGIKEGR